jgi:hypothetical protein
MFLLARSVFSQDGTVIDGLGLEPSSIMVIRDGVGGRMLAGAFVEILGYQARLGAFFGYSEAFIDAIPAAVKKLSGSRKSDLKIVSLLTRADAQSQAALDVLFGCGFTELRPNSDNLSLYVVNEGISCAS